MAGARDSNFVVYSNLNGGLNTRATPLVIEAGSKSKMQSPALRNVDFFSTGSIAKRLGKTKQGSTVASIASYASQTGAATTYNVATAARTPWLAMKFTSGVGATINQIDLQLAFSSTGTPLTISASIYTDVAGAPGAQVGAGSIGVLNVVSSTTPTTLVFTGNATATISGATAYWILVQTSSTPITGTLYYKGQAGSLARTSVDGGATYQNPSADIYYVLYSTAVGTTAIQGVYDYRFGSASTQKVVAVVNGGLYWNNAGTWTNLNSGLGAGQDNLWAFATLKDYLFTMDNGNSQGRVWNGSASYTPILGFRATFTATDSAAAGTVPPGVYKVMAVTTLISGGYRASLEMSVTVGGASNHQIIIASIVAEGTSAANFGFDISTTATKWFMTDAGGTVYYKIPTGNMSTGANPPANSTTTFNITATTGLTAANTLLDEYGLEQTYFTTQIASPTGKYLDVFQNMLALGGDATYPSRVWFSGIADGTNLAGPQIWSTAGGLYGNYRDLDNQDGEVITGLHEWNGNLYAFKRHSVFLISFTGVAGNPFEVRRLSGNLGALSHWSIKETQRGLVFISERGPCICTGTTVSIIPAAKNILDRFDLNDANRYNLAAMAYTTAGNNSTKMQISWGVSSTSATTRDITLVYDYENDAFWENDVSANYYSEVTDSNFFPSVWSGDYSAQVFRMDYGTNDNGSAISFTFETPDLSLAKPFNVHVVDHLFIAGVVQSSGTLTVDVYTDFSTTAAMTLTYDMTVADFKKGLNKPIGLTCSEIRFKLSNSALDIPVQIDAIGIASQDKGLRI